MYKEDKDDKIFTHPRGDEVSSQNIIRNVRSCEAVTVYDSLNKVHSRRRLWNLGTYVYAYHNHNKAYRNSNALVGASSVLY